MTSEEMQRTMEFILQAQAQTAANMQKAEERMTRMESSLTELLAVGEMHEQEINELRELGKATDERLNVLIGVVEKHISGGNGHQ